MPNILVIRNPNKLTCVYPPIGTIKFTHVVIKFNKTNYTSWLRVISAVACFTNAKKAAEQVSSFAPKVAPFVVLRLRKSKKLLYANFTYLFLIWFNFLNFIIKTRVLFKIKSLKKLAKRNGAYRQMLNVFRRICYKNRLIKLPFYQKSRLMLATVNTFFFKDLTYFTN